MNNGQVIFKKLIPTLRNSIQIIIDPNPRIFSEVESQHKPYRKKMLPKHVTNLMHFNPKSTRNERKNNPYYNVIIEKYAVIISLNRMLYLYRKINTYILFHHKLYFRLSFARWITKLDQKLTIKPEIFRVNTIWKILVWKKKHHTDTT